MPIPVMWTFGAIFSGNLVGKLKTKQIILLGLAFYQSLRSYYLHYQHIHHRSLFMWQSDYSA